MKLFLSVFTLTVLFLSNASAAAPVTPPLQPDSGPGGKEYAHASVIEHTYGSGDMQYWLFEPDSPKPKAAPVVIFGHGWSAMKPSIYKVWIEHIVRRGNIVIYPRYQGSLKTPLAKLTPNAIEAVKKALERMQMEPGHVRPLLDKVAVVGHSAGGAMAANMAVRAAKSGLPSMRALYSLRFI